MDQHCTPETYTWQEYLQLHIGLTDIIPCLLCGKLHKLKIHAYLERKVREPTTGRNRTIIILVIICLEAKDKEQQYTKRILPPFLNPYCVISLERTMAYLQRYPDGTINREIGCQVLGTVDPRTVLRHIRMTMQRIKEAELLLNTFLSQMPSYAQITAHRIGQTPVESLEETCAEVHRATVRVQGGSAAKIPVLVYVYAVGVSQKTAIPLAVPLTLVLRAWVFDDTS